MAGLFAGDEAGDDTLGVVNGFFEIVVDNHGVEFRRERKFELSARYAFVDYLARFSASVLEAAAKLFDRRRLDEYGNRALAIKPLYVDASP